MNIVIVLLVSLVVNIVCADDAIKQELTADSVKTISQEEIKKAFGSFDPFKALDQSDEYKDEIKKIEKEIEKRKQDLKSIEDAAMKKKTELETMGNALNESARERKQEELVQMEAQYRVKMQKAQSYAEEAEQKARMKVLKTIQVEAELIAKEEGKLVVFAGGVVYADPSIDLTDKIVERINKKYNAAKQKQQKTKDIDAATQEGSSIKKDK